MAAALEGQRALLAELWPDPGPLRVRMGLHTGEVDLRPDGRYFGPPLFRVARLMATGHGGQVLLSSATTAQLRDALPAGSGLKDLGSHRLKDLTEPEQVSQLLHPDLPAEFPALRSLSARPNNLPLQVTSFVGREQELAEVKRLLTATRLLTLTGAGGSGKTRLALQSAAELLEEYPDGVWFVDLAPLAQPELVPQTVATVLSVREEAGQPMLDTLSKALAGKALLVVLDNCEHVIAECALLADTLLRSCSKLALLATSREPLAIPGETTWRVPPLGVADPEHLPPIDQLSQYEAVRLFIDRAVAVQPRFDVTRQNAPAVAQICYRLDGIPLAIELAAARVRALSAEQIAARLDDRFRLLTGSNRMALPRQQTLRALVDWSYELLTETEQALLRRLSVFAGGWTLEAAEAVCSGAPIEPFEVLDLLTALVDKSLVLAEGQPDGQTRYRMLETFRQYGAGKLTERAEEAAVSAEHLAWCSALLAEAETALAGPDQALWLDRIAREHDNCRAALSRAIGLPDPESGLRLAGVLWFFWWSRCFYTEGREWVIRLAALPGASSFALELAQALDGAGVLARDQGQVEDALKLHGQAVALNGLAGNDACLARSLNNLGWVHTFLGNYPEARSLAGEALSILDSSTPNMDTVRTFAQLAFVDCTEGRYSEARPFADKALSIARQIDNKFGIAYAHIWRNWIALAVGDYDVARPGVRESLELFHAIGEQRASTYALEVALGLEALDGDAEKAMVLAGAAASAYEVTGTRTPGNWRECVEGWTETARERLSQTGAERAWEEGRQLSLTEALEYALR